VRKTGEAAARLEALASRFELTIVDGGAVLLDTLSGQILSLNGTAAEIWSRSLAGDPPDTIASDMAKIYGVELEAVRTDIARTLEVPPHVPPERVDDFKFEASPDGRYLAVTDDGPVLELAATGERVQILRPVSGPTLESYLCAVAPKLLALAGEIVLHASAVRYGSKAMAFLGASGAGKTTTAHAFAAGGEATVLAEDMLLVRVTGDRTWSAMSAEPAVRAWAASRAMPRQAGDEVDFSSCLAGQVLESAKLVAFHFMDRRRRRGTAVEPVALSTAETAARLFGNSFMSSLRPDARRKHFSRVLSLAKVISGYELSLPDGIDRLKEAAAAHLRAECRAEPPEVAG
jgi:hypothetical protein